MGIYESILQLPSDDFTTACDITIIFFIIGIPVLLFFNVDGKIILWLTMALICGLWYICILEII
jgi:hypothetical protein